MRAFWLAFVPMFVAVDPVGMLPVFIGLVGDLDSHRRRRVILQSMITALLVAFGFLAIGNQIFRLMGVSIADFLVAGGALLFVIALADLLSVDKQRRKMVPDHETVGAVPLGVPLIVGPGVLATSLVLLDQHGVLLTGAAVAANVLLTGLILFWARPILDLLGAAGSRVISKLASLILAALAVMFIRRGLVDIVAGIAIAARQATGE